MAASGQWRRRVAAGFGLMVVCGFSLGLLSTREMEKARRECVFVCGFSLGLLTDLVWTMTRCGGWPKLPFHMYNRFFLFKLESFIEFDDFLMYKKLGLT